MLLPGRNRGAGEPDAPTLKVGAEVLYRGGCRRREGSGINDNKRRKKGVKKLDFSFRFYFWMVPQPFIPSWIRTLSGKGGRLVQRGSHTQLSPRSAGDTRITRKKKCVRSNHDKREKIALKQNIGRLRESSRLVIAKKRRKKKEMRKARFGRLSSRVKCGYRSLNHQRRSDQC